jgi:hypothetical protein
MQRVVQLTRVVLKIIIIIKLLYHIAPISLCYLILYSVLTTPSGRVNWTLLSLIVAVVVNGLLLGCCLMPAWISSMRAVNSCVCSNRNNVVETDTSASSSANLEMRQR